MFFHGAAIAAAQLTLGVAIMLATPEAFAAPAHEALVIGNATYTSLPSLPACALSAHSAAAALRGAGFNVVERVDVTTGGADAAISEFARRLAASPGASGFVYVCAYTTAFNDRVFVLPVKWESRSNEGPRLSLNAAEFRLYRKYESRATISFGPDASDDNQKKDDKKDPPVKKP